MKNNLKEEKAITLVALIITIIILLILATVSINLIMNGGIISKAQNTVSDYKLAEENEQIQLGYSDYQLALSMGQQENLTVEGATVTGNEQQGWAISFSGSGNEYILDKDGKTTKIDKKSTFTFKIGDQTCLAEEGMNWGSWCSSSYNTLGVIIKKGEDGYYYMHLRIDGIGSCFVGTSAGGWMSSTYNDLHDLSIEENCNYTAKHYNPAPE